MSYNVAMASTSPEAPANLRLRPTLLKLAGLLVAAMVIGMWLVLTPRGLLGKADAIGYAVCHRIASHSFHLGERSFPLCARCTGMYLGGLFTLLYYGLRRPRAGLFPPRRYFIIFALFGLIWALDGINSYMDIFPSAPHIYPPSNTLRMISGTLVGIPLATLVYPVFNQSIWREWQPVSVLGSPGDLIVLLGLGAILIPLVIGENPLILYPLAILSSISVLALLTIIYATISVIVLRLENRADSRRDLALPIIAGLTLAIIQIALIGIGRHFFIGEFELNLLRGGVVWRT